MHPFNSIYCTMVWYHCSFWFSSRARCINNISYICRNSNNIWIFFTIHIKIKCFNINKSINFFKLIFPFCLRKYKRCITIFKHKLYPILWKMRIHWHICMTRFYNSINSNHHFKRTFHHNTNNRISFFNIFYNAICQTIYFFIKLFIRKLFSLES